MTKFYNRVILMMLALMVSVSTFADDVEKDGIRYRVDWEKKEAVVICKDPEPRANEYNYSGDIVIPSVINGGIAVTGIESEAFCYSGVTSISLPNSLVSIGDDAFRYSCLETIVIPNSVKSIGKGAFSKCNMLTSVTISESVTSIGADAFYGAHRLSSIVVKEGNKVYDSRNNCNAIIETETNTLIAGCKNTIMPNTVMSIGDNAFYNCFDLASIAIPESVSSIGDWAFAGCRSLASITIPKSVTSIGDWAFGNFPLPQSPTTLLFLRKFRNTLLDVMVLSVPKLLLFLGEIQNTMMIPVVTMLYSMCFLVVRRFMRRQSSGTGLPLWRMRNFLLISMKLLVVQLPLQTRYSHSLVSVWVRNRRA